MQPGNLLTDEALRRISAAVRIVEAMPAQRRKRGAHDVPFMQYMHFRVVSEENDYVVAKAVEDWGTGPTNNTLSTNTTNLAKPPHLRVSEYTTEVMDATTWARNSANTRTATSGEDTESQLIISRYLTPSGAFLGSLVLAVRGISNGTGVFVDDEELEWQIEDAREWAKQKAVS